ncbi:MAG: ribonuclease J [Alphaproteobacteria bacterium]|nr:ribonuclease J [Alphaproteobacteria bacterium]
MTKKSKGLMGLNFISIGGCSEIGMNLYAYIYNDQWILVDMGMGFDSNLGRELIVPSPDELIKNKSKIKALFITHSHEDHIGAIPYLWPMIECPIYARPFAIEMIRSKLEEFDLAREVPLIKVSLHQKEIKVGPFGVEFISVAHSTPESCAFAIKTLEGTVIHSGDWRIDNDPVLGTKTDEKKLKAYGEKGVLALICDSTNVFKEESYRTEKEVRNNLIDLVKQHKGHRILITCFASNLARLESCYYAAKESGRKLVVAGRSLKKIERVAKAAGYFSDIPAFYGDKSIKDFDPAEVLIVCTGSQGEMSSALNKIANDAHRYIKLDRDDVVIFSSRTIPGNEKAVSEIQNLMVEKGVQIVTDLDYDIHASGHPSREELEHLYKLIKPKILIPIHGERMHLHKQAEIAAKIGIKNILIPHDGYVINIGKDGAKVVQEKESKVLAVDGTQLIPMDGNIYKSRGKLSTDGVVSLCVKHSKSIFKLVAIDYVGIFEDSEKQEMKDIEADIKSEIKLSLENIVREKSLDEGKAKDLIKKIVKTVFLDHRGKKPVVISHIVS